MHTLCPECHTQRKISAKELKRSQGMVRCSHCATMFDALELLNEKQVSEKTKTNDPQYNLSVPKSSFLNKLTPYWGLAYTLCIFLFIFQIYYFEGYNLTQNNTLRPWLEKSCSLLDCQLPPYKNLNEFTILLGSFEPTKNKHYFFKTSFINQSAFEQNHPSIKLTLLDYTGHPFAERVFHPQEYLNHPTGSIKPDMSAEVTMDVAAPAKNIGGYRFEFI